MTSEASDIEMLSTIPALFAEAEAPAGGGAGDMFTLLLLVGATILIFYFFMIRPERVRRKHMQEMLDALKKNDKVLTNGGIVGWVQRVKENEVVLKVDEKTGASMTVVRQAIAQVLDQAAGSASSEKEQSDDEHDDEGEAKPEEDDAPAATSSSGGGGGGGKKGKGKKGKR